MCRPEWVCLLLGSYPGFMEGKPLLAVCLPCSTTYWPFGNCRSSGDPYRNIHKCIVCMVVPTAFKSEHLFLGGHSWNCGRCDTEVVAWLWHQPVGGWRCLVLWLAGRGLPQLASSCNPCTVVAQLQNRSFSNKEALQSRSGNSVLSTRVPLLPQTVRFLWLWGTEQ